MLDAERDQRMGEDLRWLLSSSQGRRVCMWLVRDVGAIEGISFRAAPAGHVVAAIKEGVASMEHMAFHEGRRDMAVDIRDALARADYHGFMKARREHDEAMEAEHARLDSYSAEESQIE